MLNYNEVFEWAAKASRIELGRKYNPPELTTFIAEVGRRAVDLEGAALMKNITDRMYDLNLFHNRRYDIFTRFRDIINRRRDLGIKSLSLKEAFELTYGEEGNFEIELTDLNEKINSDRHGGRIVISRVSPVIFRDLEKLKKKIRSVSEIEIIRRVVLTSNF